MDLAKKTVHDNYGTPPLSSVFLLSVLQELWLLNLGSSQITYNTSLVYVFYLE